MRRDEGLALLLMADGWPSERTSHLHDERVGGMIEDDVQGPSLFSATGTTFIMTCQQPSCATRGSFGFSSWLTGNRMTNKGPVNMEIDSLVWETKVCEVTKKFAFYRMCGFVVLVLFLSIFLIDPAKMNNTVNVPKALISLNSVEPDLTHP